MKGLCRSRHCERSEAIQVRARSSGLLRRHSPSKTGVNALLPRNDEIKSRSRGAIFVRRCGFSDLGSSTFSIDRGALASSFRSPEREKGSGTPVDADPYPPHPAVRLAPCKARSPAGVPLAALVKGTFVPKAQCQAMLPGTRPERTILWPPFRARSARRSTGVTRAAPVPVQ